MAYRIRSLGPGATWHKLTLAPSCAGAGAIASGALVATLTATF